MVPTSTLPADRANETATGAAPRLSPDVFLVEADGVARLLDFARGRFYALNPVASRMLALCLEDGPGEAAARLAAEYHAPPERVRADLTALLRDLEGKHLLVSAPNPGLLRARLLAGLAAGLVCADRALFRPLRVAGAALASLFRRGRRPRGVPGLWTLRLQLTLAWISLRLFGWTGTLSLWRRWHQKIPAPAPADAAGVLEELDRRVREAAVGKLFFPAACKERALVGYQVLRALHGLPATLVIGVQCHPFAAHAWVECGGVILTDDPARCELYTPVARYR